MAAILTEPVVDKSCTPPDLPPGFTNPTYNCRLGVEFSTASAARAAGWVPPTVAEYVDQQYRGAKAGLRPIYDALAAAITGLGDDVSVEGRSSYTPFVRGRQFAAVAAATRDRVDLGLRFTDPPDAARLQPSNGPGQATHKLSLRAAGEVDAEVLSLLRTAYEQNA